MADLVRKAELEAVREENARLKEAVTRADELLDRLARWDVMQSTGDGEWWRGEIARCRAALGDRTEETEVAFQRERPPLTEEERDKLNAFEAAAIEQREIEGEWLAQIERLGFGRVTHGSDAPCFSCTLTCFLEGIEDDALASSTTEERE